MKTLRAMPVIASTAAILAMLSMSSGLPAPALAQDTTAADASATPAPDTPEPLSEDEMEVLVARIALYPDDLVAAILAASIYPLQVVQADRYLDQVKKKKDLQPDKSWDGSIVSLLNYPEVIGMMNDDLDWTQQLGDAVTNQQKDVLDAIQQLRDTAVAKGVIQSDDKTKVERVKDTIVIQSADANVVYVPTYEPQVLYDDDYPPAPVAYYPEPYPSYYSPAAPYFAGFITGAVWGAIVDWDDGGVWGGNGNWGNDIDIDCNNCFNNRDFNGKVNFNDVDWKNVDRSKIKFDRNQLNNIDRSKLRNGLEADGRNDLKKRAKDVNRNRASMPGGKGKPATNDIRRDAMKELKKPGAGNRPANAGNLTPRDKTARPSAGDRPAKNAKKPSGGKIDRPVGKPKPGGRPDARPQRPSPMGDVTRGRDANAFSDRGGRSMGGGMNRGGGGAQKIRRPPGGGGGGHRGGGGGRRR